MKKILLIILALAVAGNVMKSINQSNGWSSPSPSQTQSTTDEKFSPSPKPSETTEEVKKIDKDTPKDSVLKAGEWAIVGGCEIRLMDGLSTDPSPFLTNFQDNYDDISFLQNSQWSIKELGDYVYVNFEIKKNCDFFGPISVYLSSGYDEWWGSDNSLAWSNNWQDKTGNYRFINIYKTNNSTNNFSVKLNHGVGPTIKFYAESY